MTATQQERGGGGTVELIKGKFISSLMRAAQLLVGRDGFLCVFCGEARALLWLNDFSILRWWIANNISVSRYCRHHLNKWLSASPHPHQRPRRLHSIRLIRISPRISSEAPQYPSAPSPHIRQRALNRLWCRHARLNLFICTRRWVDVDHSFRWASVWDY